MINITNGVRRWIGDPMTLGEAFAAFDVDKLYTEGKSQKTRDNYRTTLHSLLKVISVDFPVELITYIHIIQWKQYVAQLGWKPSYIATNLSHMREVFKYLKRHNFEVLDWREIERPTVPPSNPVWLTIEEVIEFLNVIESVRDKALFACLFTSAARISELLQLNRDSIHDGEAQIIGKGSKPGTLYFNATALKLLDEYLESRKDKLEPLFVSGQYRRITVSRVEQLAHIYADMAGIEKNVTPHTFRHSRASDFKLNGADIYDIQKQLRHSSINTTQMYAHIGQEKIKSDYQRYGSSLPL